MTTQTSLTEVEQNALLKQYCTEIYKIADSMAVSLISDTDRENFALAALETAIKTFNPSKGVKFTTYLYTLIKNRLLDAHKMALRARKNGIGFSERVEFTNEANNDDYGDDDVLVHGSKYLSLAPSIDEEAINEADARLAALNAGLKSGLTERQWNILQMMASPEETFALYEAKFSDLKGEYQCTYNVIGDLIGISNPMVTKEVKVIRNVTENIKRSLNKGK